MVYDGVESLGKVAMKVFSSLRECTSPTARHCTQDDVECLSVCVEGLSGF